MGLRERPFLLGAGCDDVLLAPRTGSFAAGDERRIHQTVFLSSCTTRPLHHPNPKARGYPGIGQNRRPRLGASPESWSAAADRPTATPMAAPATTSERKCFCSASRMADMNVAPQRKGTPITGPWRRATTVAIAKEPDAWPDGNDNRLLPSGRRRWATVFKAMVIVCETT